MDILTGTGEVITASPDQHPDLYRGFPNSYGTLGYSVRLRIELEPVKPFVALRHLRFHSLAELIAAMDRIVDTGGHRRRARSTISTAWCSAPTKATCASACRPPRPDPSATTPASRSTTARSSTPEKTEPRRPIADHPRLPVAVGHRLVLVLAGVRRAEPAHPAVLAAAATAQQLLLEAHRLRPAVRHRRPDREAQRPPAARTGGPGRRGADRTVRRVPRVVPGQRADRADLAVPVAASRLRRAGRCTRSGPGTPTSTSGSGRRCRSAPRTARPTG